MNINTKYNINNTIYINKPNAKEEKSETVNPQRTASVSLFGLSADTLKANFCPSFGRYKKIGYTKVTDKTTNKPVEAEVRREQADNFVSYKLVKGKDEIGSIEMDLSSLFPEDDFVLSLPDNIVPKILSITPTMEDKYIGVKSALIEQAIKESRVQGEKGYVWVESQKAGKIGGKNSIPFFYQYGFRSPDERTNKLINQCMNETRLDRLPANALLLIDPKNAFCNTNRQNEGNNPPTTSKTSKNMGIMPMPILPQ